MDWINTWIGALTKPKETFAERKAEANLNDGMKMYAVVGLVLGALMGVLLLALTAVLGPMLSMFGLGWLTALGIVGIVVIPIVMALVYVVASLVSMWVFNFVCGLLGGKGSFEQLYFLSSLFVVPVMVLSMVLNVIPFIGALIAFLLMLYTIYLFYLVVKEVHDFDAVKFIIALVIDAVIHLIIMVVLGIIFGMLFASLLPKMPTSRYG